MATEDKKPDPNKDTGEELLTDDEKRLKLEEGEESLDEEGKEKPPDTGEAEKVGISPKIKDYMTKHGIKDLDELIERSEKDERKITQLSRERRLMTPATMEPTVTDRSRKRERAKVEIPQDTYGMITDPEKFGSFMDKVSEVIDQNVGAIVQDTLEQKEVEGMKRQFMKLADKDPEKMDRLLPIMNGLSKRYQNADIIDLYEMAEEVEVDNKERTKKEIAKELLGSEDALPRLKALLEKGGPTGHISGGTGGEPGDEKLTGIEKQKKAVTDAILEASTLKS